MKMLTKQITVRFDENLWNKVTASAKEQGISFNEYVRRAVKEYLLREGKKKQT